MMMMMKGEEMITFRAETNETLTPFIHLSIQLCK